MIDDGSDEISCLVGNFFSLLFSFFHENLGKIFPVVVTQKYTMVYFTKISSGANLLSHKRFLF